MEGDLQSGELPVPFAISIHTLRMEGDVDKAMNNFKAMLISIHTLRMEGDTFERFINLFFDYFNPHPPHGG